MGDGAGDFWLCLLIAMKTEAQRRRRRVTFPAHASTRTGNKKPLWRRCDGNVVDSRIILGRKLANIATGMRDDSAT